MLRRFEKRQFRTLLLVSVIIKDHNDNNVNDDDNDDDEQRRRRQQRRRRRYLGKSVNNLFDTKPFVCAAIHVSLLTNFKKGP